MKNQNYLANTRITDELSPYFAPSAPGGETADQDGIKIEQILATFMRRRRIMLIAFLGVISIVAAYTWATRPVYKATASILVDGSEGHMGGSSELPLLSDLQEMTQARSVETQTEIIKSFPIQDGALKRLSPKLRTALGESPDVEVKSVKGTDVIQVATYSHSPEAAAALSNAVCNEYVMANRLGNREQTHAAAEYAHQQMQAVRDKLIHAETDLKVYKQKNLTVDLTAESQQRISQLAQIESELRQTQAERSACMAQLSGLRQMTSHMAPTEVTSTTLAPSPTVDAIRAELTRLEFERASTMQEYIASSPEVSRIDKQIVDARKRLQQEARTEVRSTQTALNPVRQSTAQDLAKTQASLWAQEARVKALDSACMDVKAELAKLPEREFRLAELTTELGVIQQTYEMLNQEYHRLRISEEARLANARVIAPAVPPKGPVSPRKALNMMLAAILGVMLAAGLAALFDRMDDRVHSEDDVELATGRPVLAHVPYIKTEEERCLTAIKQKNSPLLESFRMLRNNISLSMVDESIKSVVITSSEPSEGKTHTSANLAIAMALDGKRVILVEGDLRRPSVHKLFKLSNHMGVTNVISGKMTLDEALQESGVSGLRILASGPLPPNPPELLNSRACRATMQQILDNADFVVVDSPPSLVMADAQVISTMTDGAILVVSAGQSHKNLVGRVSSMLGQTSGKMLGVVINKLQADPGGYYGYYGYYSYDSYHKYSGYYSQEPQLASTASENSKS